MGRKYRTFDNQVHFLKSEGGFTLVEMLIVIAVLGVLIISVIIALNPSLMLGKVRDAIRKTDIRSISGGLVDYAINRQGCYPQVLGWEGELRPNYLKSVPRDPKTHQSYIYECSPPNLACQCPGYGLYANLETEEGINYANGSNYVIANGDYQPLIEPTSTPTLELQPTATPTPVYTGSDYYGCFSGVCQQISGPSACPNINYQLPDCAGQCFNPLNECH